MDGHDVALLLCGGFLLAGAAWIWIRADAPKYAKVEASFVLSVCVLWVSLLVDSYAPFWLPARPVEPFAENAAPTEEPAPGPTRRYGRLTAVYSIAAHTVYLPDGKQLEAHSGLGVMRDDPRYVNMRDRGATPPNVYQLAPLGQLFYGVRALRLIPVGDSPVFGRDGFLTHTYMLGARGESHGCIVFRDYNSFLQAYLKGEIRRLVVVAHLD